MRKRLLLLYSCLTLLAFPGIGQIIEDKNPNSFDTLRLSKECNLDNEELGKIFTKLETYADFPGGFQKWFSFANANFDFDYVIKNLRDTVNLFQDSLFVKFIVAKNGTICNTKFQKGNPLLTEPTLKLLRSSPNWNPGLNGGRRLNSYRTLRIDLYINKGQNIKTIKHFTNSYFRDNDL